MGIASLVTQNSKDHCFASNTLSPYQQHPGSSATGGSHCIYISCANVSMEIVKKTICKFVNNI